MFLSKYFCFRLSVLFHQCFTPIFVYIVLLPDRQEGKAWESPKKQCTVRIRATIDRQTLSPLSRYRNLIYMQLHTRTFSLLCIKRVPQLMTNYLVTQQLLVFWCESNEMDTLLCNITTKIPDYMVPEFIR